MSDITEPLRLAVGSHARGSGKGCAMNVISWENGDSVITDYPECSDRLLSRIVQRVNDTICTHRDGDLLCPSCSIKVLELGHRTVGTALDIPDRALARIYVQIAVGEAESVLSFATDDRPRRACALVRRFLAGEDITRTELCSAYAEPAVNAYAANAAAVAANAAAYAANVAAYAANAADAATYAANAAVNAYAANASAVATADAAAYAADAADAGEGGRLARAHRIIDRFEELTGVKATHTDPAVTAAAYSKMKETVHV